MLGTIASIAIPSERFGMELASNSNLSIGIGVATQRNEEGEFKHIHWLTLWFGVFLFIFSGLHTLYL